jgi:hypothetical protein
MVSAFFDLAELRAMQHVPMYMKDWVAELDDFARRYGKGMLTGGGAVSHQAALQKAAQEYEKYRRKTVDERSKVERDFLESIKRQAKAINAVKSIQQESLKKGVQKTTMEEIDEEIKRIREE